MADFPFNSSSAAGRAYEQLPTSYNGGDNTSIELTKVPRARAPSYVSSNSFWNGHDDDGESLIKKKDRESSFADHLKPTQPAERVVSLTPTAKSNREKRRKLQGWRFGVAVSAWVAFSVLMLNLLLTIVAVAKFGTNRGIGTALEGNCETVTSWATWLHLVINALSSILLSASNYTMQCLCSPTRKEIDQAHAKGDWMDIGVASVRNIVKIRWQRSLLWWLLALSSVPIHLLYNSAIFKALDANEYTVVVANTEFLQGQSVDNNTVTLYAGEETMDNLRAIQKLVSSSNSNVVQKLDNSGCIAAYGTSFVSAYSNLILVTSHAGANSSQNVFFLDGVSYDPTNSEVPYAWICEDLADDNNCDSTSARRNAATWTIAHVPIDYCLAQITQPHCKLQFSLQILVTVIIMNAVKSSCMFLTLLKQRETTLVTIGDALASFLDNPDERTRGRCLMAKVDVHKGPLRWRARGTKDTPNTQPLSITYHGPMRRRWFAGASVARWCITMSLIIASLAIVGGLLGLGVSSLQGDLSGRSVFDLGFGAVDSRAIIDAGLPQGGAGGLVSAVLLANLPQAICSFLYLTYNGLFTSMHLCHEYSKYALERRRKPLRVTTPHGEQRSTYYLQLPWTYSIPLLLTSGSLHWLISQSLFLVRLDVYDDGTTDDGLEYSEVGYSCLPILVVILVGTGMVAVALALGCRKFASHMPVAGSCSVALAAACHRPKGDDDAAYLPVVWGEINREGGEDIGHCCFTSETVHDLIPGRMYAGVQDEFASPHLDPTHCELAENGATSTTLREYPRNDRASSRLLRTND